MTLEMKQQERRRLVRLSFAMLAAMPLSATFMEIAPATLELYKISGACFSAVIIGHMGTSPKDTK